jgi:hypothetical protein
VSHYGINFSEKTRHFRGLGDAMRNYEKCQNPLRRLLLYPPELRALTKPGFRHDTRKPPTGQDEPQLHPNPF